MGKWADNEAKMQPLVREQIIKALWDKINLTGKDEKTPEAKFAVQMQQFQILKKELGLLVEEKNQYVETEQSKAFDEAIFNANFYDFNLIVQAALQQQAYQKIKAQSPSSDVSQHDIDAQMDKKLAVIQNGEHLSLVMVDSGNPNITPDDITDLKEYMQEKNITASVSITNQGKTFIIDQEELGANPVLAIHSVAKVFTGVLLMKLLNEGVFKETDLDKPIDLDKAVLAELSPQVQQRLQQATLRQIMLHESGLGNYLDNEGGLTDIIAKHLNSDQAPPNITSSFELLKYGDKEVQSPLGQFNYSNLGMLLLGFAIEKKYQDRQIKEQETPLLTIDDIMQRFVKNDVKLNTFESKRPDNGIYNKTEQKSPEGSLSDRSQQYIKDFVSARFASTAGGYWTTNADLQKFGQWIKDECERSPRFKQYIKDHGAEFYNADKQAVEHSGLHADTAHFYTSLRNGTVITVLSPQGECAATNLADTILKQTTWFKLSMSQPIQPDTELSESPRVVSPAFQRSIANQNAVEQPVNQPDASSVNRKIEIKK